MFTKLKYLGFAAIIAGMVGCTAGGDNPGLEYAPQMYHSVPYEPLTQITDESLPDGIISSRYYIPNSTPYNDYQGKQPMNGLQPVEGTIKRQDFSFVRNKSGESSPLLIYDLHKDSLETAAQILKNPLPESNEVLKQGKHLYLGFCAPCHGEKGDGKGKVGEIYKGVPNYSTGRYKTLTEGHIFHVITNGKGRMWAHKTQVNPEERWMIVRYVQQLQQGKN